MTAARVLALEGLAITVLGTLGESAVDALLVKGPVTNRWLYGDSLARLYSDVDLVVAPTALPRAQRVMAQLELENFHAGVLGIFRPTYEETWSGRAGMVDVHTRLAGVPADRADDAWLVLWRRSVEFELHGRCVRTLDEVGRLMQLALHAARSDGDHRAHGELDLGVARMGVTDWRAAAGLAAEIGAMPCFQLGLRRTEAGRALLARLSLPPASNLESRLLERGATQNAIVIGSSLDGGGRLSRDLRGWFAVDGPRRPPLRAVLAAISGLPKALLLVWWTRRQQRREEGRDHAQAS